MPAANDPAGPGSQTDANTNTPPAHDAADKQTETTTPQLSAAAKASRGNLNDSIFEAVGKPMSADANEFIWQKP
jgi:hypothetical protein